MSAELKYAELISKLTLEEKASLTSGKDFWQSVDIKRDDIDIPNMFLADGPHGIRRQVAAADHLGLNPSANATCFPTAVTMANSWNDSLGEEMARCLGAEAVSQDVNVLLGPGTNMKRNPRCGRNFEYFSEDPYLAGKMAAAYAPPPERFFHLCSLYYLFFKEITLEPKYQRLSIIHSLIKYVEVLVHLLIPLKSVHSYQRFPQSLF